MERKYTVAQVEAFVTEAEIRAAHATLVSAYGPKDWGGQAGQTLNEVIRSAAVHICGGLPCWEPPTETAKEKPVSEKVREALKLAQRDLNTWTLAHEKVSEALSALKEGRL